MKTPSFFASLFKGSTNIMVSSMESGPGDISKAERKRRRIKAKHGRKANLLMRAKRK
jgi:hypothetical protein